jgi:hypothetical protein
MAISTCAELKTAIDAWTDQGGALNSYMGDFIRMATDGFNYGADAMAPLRVPQMLEVVSLTPVNAVCTLPTDFLQYRDVVQEASIRRPFRYITSSSADQLYADRSGGPATSFSIVGNLLYMFPLGSTDIELTYYQKIPQLVADGDTNWLLTAHPTLYLHAGILQVGLFRRNDDLISRSVAFMNSYVAGMRRSGEASETARSAMRLRQAP